MGTTNEGAWVLALQYADNEITLLKRELEITQSLVTSFKAIEKAGMISLKTDSHAKLFQAYKGAFTKLKNYLEKQKKIQSKI